MAEENNTTAEKFVYLLYIPGGAMLGCIPLKMLTELERLTGRSSRDLFQAFEGASTGAICVSSLLSGHSAQETLDAYKIDGQRIFEPIDNRKLKMSFTNVASSVFSGADPLKRHRYKLGEIIRTSNQLMRSLDESYFQDFDNLKKFSKQEIISKSSQNNAAKICKKLLADKSIDLESHELIKTMDIYIEQITPTGTLSSFFYKVARKPVDLVIKYWAGDHYYSSETPREIFKERFGKRRLSDSPKSIYMPAYNQEDGQFKHFYHRKDDLFANNQDAPGQTSDGNEFIWDSTMASIASPFAFVPHKTLTGNIYTDQALIHSPVVSVSDLHNRNKTGPSVKLVYFGVGRYDETFIMQEHKKLGVIGRVLSGGMLSDMENYTVTMADQVIRNLIGVDNISVFNPRLTTNEVVALNLEPSRDTLDATPENTQKLEQIADSYIEIPRVKARLHNLAIDLSENLYNLGQLNKDDFELVKKRCDCAHIDENKPHHQDQRNSPWQGVKSGLGWAPGP